MRYRLRTLMIVVTAFAVCSAISRGIGVSAAFSLYGMILVSSWTLFLILVESLNPPSRAG